MKSTSLKILVTAALSVVAVSAANANPAFFNQTRMIAYDQGGNDPFPTSAPEADASVPVPVAYDQGGNDPFPTSAPEAGTSGVTILAYHEGGTDPFPPSPTE